MHRPSRDLCPLLPAPARLHRCARFSAETSGTLPFSARAAGAQIKKQLRLESVSAEGRLDDCGSPGDSDTTAVIPRM